MDEQSSHVEETVTEPVPTVQRRKRSRRKAAVQQISGPPTHEMCPPGERLSGVQGHAHGSIEDQLKADFVAKTRALIYAEENVAAAAQRLRDAEAEVAHLTRQQARLAKAIAVLTGDDLVVPDLEVPARAGSTGVQPAVVPEKPAAPKGQACSACGENLVFPTTVTIKDRSVDIKQCTGCGNAMF